METPNTREQLMTDLINLLYRINKIFDSETFEVDETSDFTDSRPPPQQEKQDNFKDIIRKHDQFQNNSSVQLAMKCLTILDHPPNAAEVCWKDFTRLFPIYYNVAVIALAISNFVVMAMLEFANEITKTEEKNDLERVLKYVHEHVSKNEGQFMEIADSMPFLYTDKMKPKIDRISHISEQCRTDMKECNTQLKMFMTKRRISEGSIPKIRKTSWNLVSLGAVTITESGVATVATGGINVAANLKQEIHRIQKCCERFLQEAESLQKIFHELEIQDRDINFNVKESQT